MALDTPDTRHDIPDSASSVADEAEAEARSTLQRLRAQADEVIERMKPKLDAVTEYVRDEPTKGMLASAAVGAGVMALIVLATRMSSRPTVRSGTLSSIRDAALDLADRAHVAANDALAIAQSRSRGFLGRAGLNADQAFKAAQKRSDALHKAARSRTDDAALSAQAMADDAVAAAQQKASDASDAASAALQDAWGSLREHTDPVIDRFRPQLEAAARYARDDPARAAIGVATAGALLIGLFALAKSASSD